MREIKLRYIFTNKDGTIKLFHTTLRQIEEQSFPIGFTQSLTNGEEFERVLFTGLYDNTKWGDLPQYEQQLFRISLGTESGEVAKENWRGKEIYEGDIVKVPNHHQDRVLWKAYIGKIEWIDCAWTIVEADGNLCEYINEDDLYKLEGTRDVEVIGNIYENPELLDAEQSTGERQ